MPSLHLQFPKRGRKTPGDNRSSSTPTDTSPTIAPRTSPPPTTPLGIRPPAASNRSTSVPTRGRPGTAASSAEANHEFLNLQRTAVPRPFSTMTANSEPGSPGLPPFAPSQRASMNRPGSSIDAGSPILKNRASTGMLDPSGRPAMRNPDDFVMDTNNSSIVSKRSVERLYQAGEPEYFRHFVSKFKRRSPLINRGYWLRMRAIEYAITRFLAEQTSKTKLVINLGCGYDPLPFSFLGKQRELCENTLFVDVDFPALMQNKVAIISKTEQLNTLIPDVTFSGDESGLLATSLSYAAVGCDLRNLDTLRSILQEQFQAESSPVSIMFVAEVSIAYMEAAASQAVIEWAATYDDVRFALLEQHVPDGLDHPFALTMVSHFNKLRTPLHSLGTLEQMKARFASAGWPDRAIEAHSLWELWAEPAFVSPEIRRWLDTIEPFDEWEEFALFASHYFLLVAERKADQDYQYRPPRASFVSSRIPAAMSSESSVAPNITETDPASVLVAQELPTAHSPRRFAALTPPALRGQDGDAIGLHGGLGMQERRSDCDTYSWFDTAQKIEGPPLRSGIMCHTMTRLGGTNNCMLVGGRTAPDKASADCWLRQDGVWEKVASLPEGRFRHCAVPVRLPTEPRPAHTVLIYGGKTSEGHVLDEWLLWTGEAGWQSLRVVGDHPCARFGAAMITDKAEGISGIIVGGLTSAGRVLADFWHWNLQPDMSITCQSITARASGVLKSNTWIMGRFGAQLVRSDQGILLVGGITGGRMLTRNEQWLNMRTLRTTPLRGARQLYVGCSVQNVDGGILILGGGATCFSFGTFWNKNCILTPTGQRREDMTWQLVSDTASATTLEPKTLIVPPALVPGTNNTRPISQAAPPQLTLPKIDTGDSIVVQAPVESNITARETSTAPDARASITSSTFETPTTAVSTATSSGENNAASTTPRIGSIGKQISSERITIKSAAYQARLHGPTSDPIPPVPEIRQYKALSNGHSSSLPSPKPVQRIQLSNINPFEKYLQAAQPAIITNASFGSCTQFWSDTYLKEAVGGAREVVVHSSSDERMDFLAKNFSYVTQTFSDFIDAAARGDRVYLRSLSRQQPSKTPASLAEDFPELAQDFQLPAELEYVSNNMHSTPLRISGPVAVWLHYDVMDNILCQIRGSKRIVLFPPSNVSRLGFTPGASTSSLDVLGISIPDPSSASALAQTQPYEAILGPGDALFIPATWAHAAAAPEAGKLSVAVNCFFRGMAPNAYAAGRDVYGNRDVAPYERGRRDIARIASSFDDLPPQVAAFYMERLASELLERARTVAASGGDTIHASYAELD